MGGNVKNIMKNVTITQKSGEKQIYDAIHITKKGVYTGHIIIKTEAREEFEDHGFIPRDQIQKITACTEHGKARDIDL
jgi:tRNA threonylcarbamoyladenosine modification (KEOPS) complex Cgi121 subunit